MNHNTQAGARRMSKREQLALRRLLVVLAGAGVCYAAGTAWNVWQAAVAAVPLWAKCLGAALANAAVLARWAGKAGRR